MLSSQAIKPAVQERGVIWDQACSGNRTGCARHIRLGLQPVRPRGGGLFSGLWRDGTEQLASPGDACSGRRPEGLLWRPDCSGLRCARCACLRGLRPRHGSRSARGDSLAPSPSARRRAALRPSRRPGERPEHVAPCPRAVIGGRPVESAACVGAGVILRAACRSSKLAEIQRPAPPGRCPFPFPPGLPTTGLAAAPTLPQTPSSSLHAHTHGQRTASRAWRSVS